MAPAKTDRELATDVAKDIKDRGYGKQMAIFDVSERLFEDGYEMVAALDMATEICNKVYGV